MKILVLYTPRSGSTNFTNTISKYFKIKNITYPIKNSYDSNKIHDKIKFLKKLSGFVLKQHTLCEYDKLKLLIDSFDFDNIIMLSRISNLDAAQSLSYMRTHTDSFNPWSTKYKYLDSSVNDQTEKECKNKIMYAVNMINLLSAELNVPIFYYEDLYLGDQEKTLENTKLDINIKTFLKILNSTEKQRILPDVSNYLI